MFAQDINSGVQPTERDSDFLLKGPDTGGYQAVHQAHLVGNEHTPAPRTEHTGAFIQNRGVKLQILDVRAHQLAEGEVSTDGIHLVLNYGQAAPIPCNQLDVIHIAACGEILSSARERCLVDIHPDWVPGTLQGQALNQQSA